MIDYSLYLCADSEINESLTIKDCVEQAIIGGVTFVQLREKNKQSKDIIKIAKEVKKVTDKYHIPLVINDYVDIALKINADGVHLGQDDMPCYKARKLLGKDKIIGITVTNVEEATKAIADGADYLGVGAMYQSKTKVDAKIVSNKELDKIIKISKIPVIIIGGINENTIPNFKNKNIAGYAMIRAIIGKNDIIMATQKLKKLIENNR